MPPSNQDPRKRWLSSAAKDAQQQGGSRPRRNVLHVPDNIQRAFTAERIFYVRDRLTEYVDKVCEIPERRGDAQLLAFQAAASPAILDHGNIYTTKEDYINETPLRSTTSVGGKDRAKIMVMRDVCHKMSESLIFGELSMPDILMPDAQQLAKVTSVLNVEHHQLLKVCCAGTSAHARRPSLRVPLAVALLAACIVHLTRVRAIPDPQAASSAVNGQHGYDGGTGSLLLLGAVLWVHNIFVVHGYDAAIHDEEYSKVAAMSVPELFDPMQETCVRHISFRWKSNRQGSGSSSRLGVGPAPSLAAKPTDKFITADECCSAFDRDPDNSVILALIGDNNYLALMRRTDLPRTDAASILVERTGEVSRKNETDVAQWIQGFHHRYRPEQANEKTIAELRQAERLREAREDDMDGGADVGAGSATVDGGADGGAGSRGARRQAREEREATVDGGADGGAGGRGARRQAREEAGANVDGGGGADGGAGRRGARRQLPPKHPPRRAGRGDGMTLFRPAADTPALVPTTAPDPATAALWLKMPHLTNLDKSAAVYLQEKKTVWGGEHFVPAIEVWDSPWDKLPALIQIILEKRGFTEEAWNDENFSLEESDETYRSGEMVGVDVHEEFDRAFAEDQPTRINGYVLKDILWAKGMPVHWFYSRMCRISMAQWAEAGGKIGGTGLAVGYGTGETWEDVNKDEQYQVEDYTNVGFGYWSSDFDMLKAAVHECHKSASPEGLRETVTRIRREAGENVDARGVPCEEERPGRVPFEYEGRCEEEVLFDVLTAYQKKFKVDYLDGFSMSDLYANNQICIFHPIVLYLFYELVLDEADRLEAEQAHDKFEREMRTLSRITHDDMPEEVAKGHLPPEEEPEPDEGVEGEPERRRETSKRAVTYSGAGRLTIQDERRKNAEEVACLGYTKTGEWVGRRANGAVVALSTSHVDAAFDNEDGITYKHFVMTREGKFVKVPAGRPRPSKPLNLSIGTRVKARHLASSVGPANTRWFPATVAAMNKDGTVDVKYDDGDQENDVKREYIKLADGVGPALSYKQGDMAFCVPYGLACALAAAGFAMDAAQIAKEAADIARPDGDPLARLRGFVTARLKLWAACDYVAGDGGSGILSQLYDVTEDGLPTDTTYPIVLQLEDSAGNVNHCVTAWSSWLFDSAEEAGTALPYKTSSLHRACHPNRFTRVHAAFRLEPAFGKEPIVGKIMAKAARKAT